MKQNFFDFRESIVKRRPSAPPPATTPPVPPAVETPVGRAAGPKAEPLKPDPLTVLQITERIRNVLRAGIRGTLHVRGEVSNFKRNARSGHAYFTLKDPGACIECIMMSTEAAALKFRPTDGLDLVATGVIDVYPPQGKYQLKVSALDPVGRGALELAFQQMRERLEREGLFAAERKRPLPAFPLHIAIVTSAAAAAYQDVLKVLRRFPWLRPMLYDVPVQGDGAGERIAAGIRAINKVRRAGRAVDVVLLVRGGGSLEDLWSFNEECVARAIVASRVPVITGIGHETDTSIADLVADYFAHTPTEAAQVLTREWAGATESVDDIGRRLRRQMKQTLRDARARLLAVQRHEAFRRPMRPIAEHRRGLKETERALAHAVARRLGIAHRDLDALTARLRHHGPAVLLPRAAARLSSAATRLARLHPRHRLDLERGRLESLAARLRSSIASQCQRQRQRVEGLARSLRGVGPEEVLRRGYSITVNGRDGRVVRSITDVTTGDPLTTRVADGSVRSTVN